MYDIEKLLINERLSRGRMHRPQDWMSEASRPARQITARARRMQNRLMGHR